MDEMLPDRKGDRASVLGRAGALVLGWGEGSVLHLVGRALLGAGVALAVLATAKHGRPGGWLEIPEEMSLRCVTSKEMIFRIETSLTRLELQQYRGSSQPVGAAEPVC